MQRAHELLAWVEHRLEAMLARPRAWGQGEAIEMQVLLLLQLRAMLARPASERPAAAAMEWYFDYLMRAYPASPHQPLHLIAGPETEPIAAELRKATEAFRTAFRPENPFEQHRLAIRMRYRAGVSPRASSVTGYFEEFRRATRATARRPGVGSGRVAKEIEEATDFELVDIQLSPRNGAPAEALVIMGDGRGQADFVASNAVQEALTGMAELAEWADGDAGLDGLSIDSEQRRTVLALQTLRVLPRGDVAEVQVGGQMMGRARPVVYRPQFESRLVQAVGSAAPPLKFDEEGDLRAFDQDRGQLLLGKHRLRCYVRPEFMPSVVKVGQPVRVTGQLFTPTIGKQFVIVDAPIEDRAVRSEADDAE